MRQAFALLPRTDHTSRQDVIARRIRTTLAVILSGLVVASCSSSTSGNASSSTPHPAANGPASTTSAAATGNPATTTGSVAACGGGLHAGQGGILQVFCGGSGDAKITMGSASKELTGGSCVEQSGFFTINFGAVAGPDWPAGQTKPDYLGALIADSGGALQAFTIIINGMSSGVIVSRIATVSADKKHATLNGKRLSDTAPVSVAVTC